VEAAHKAAVADMMMMNMKAAVDAAADAVRVDGLAILKAILKRPKKAGKTEAVEAAVMMTTTIMDLPEAVPVIVVVVAGEEAAVVKDGLETLKDILKLPSVVGKTAMGQAQGARNHHAEAVQATMMTTAEAIVDREDGLAIRKVILKLLKEVGKTEVAVAARNHRGEAALGMTMMTILVEEVAAVDKADGLETPKVIPKLLKEAGGEGKFESDDF